MAVIVKYKEEHFLCYGKTSNGLARLIKSDGTKYSGTPYPDKLEVVRKKLIHVEFNGHTYVNTKMGVFSCSTGKKVSNPDILTVVGNAVFDSHPLAMQAMD
jgi:hypothetical protein